MALSISRDGLVRYERWNKRLVFILHNKSFIMDSDVGLKVSSHFLLPNYNKSKIRLESKGYLFKILIFDQFTCIF